MRTLSKREIAVIDVIEAQRKNGRIIGDTFPFDFIAGQQFLHDNDNSIELIIDHGQMWNIITQLAKDGIIRIDLMNVYEDGKIAWVYNTDWARRDIQMSMSIEECYKKYGARLFINISVLDLNHIRENLIDKYKTKLVAHRSDPLQLIVVCSNGKKYTLKAFNRVNAKPCIAFRYALEHSGEPITNIDLHKFNSKIAEDEYVSKMYERNNVIKKLLSRHVTLGVEEMRVEKIAYQTVAQLKAIEKKAVKIEGV